MKFASVSYLFICIVIIISTAAANAQESKDQPGGSHAILNLKNVSSTDLSSYIDSHDGNKPLFVYVTRSTSTDMNTLTDKIAQEYGARVDFIFVDIPSGSMRAFRDIEFLVKKYGFETLPVSIILDSGKLLAKIELVSHKKNPETLYRKHLDIALSKKQKNE
ncbi:MAG: hypothetical protein KZQ73_01990 [Candidatus Thiodiazotropha sp. (ex Semelilucina semeliformis)]|nr:hypothetical protein [Candidatus Thiodiazotropha sp. (ex Semelilucina semeliformis)]